MKRWLLAIAFVCLPSMQAADVSPALREATVAMQRGDFAAAELKLRAELQLHPNDGETLSLLGSALDGQGKFREADALHRRAAAAAPRSALVLGRYGNHLLTSGDEKAARTIFQRALAIDPADPYANLQLAGIALKSKDAKAALEYLDHLPAGQRQSPDAVIRRLTALDLTGDRAAADAVFNRLSEATERDPKLSASLGWALAESGDFARSETLLTHALAGDPENFHILYDLGVVALYNHHYERARDVLESAVRQQPENVDALYSLAFVYSSLKQPESTLRYVARAAKLNPNRADVQRLIAVTTGELQANEDSAEAWDRYAVLAPNDDTARRERGFARIHLRQFDTGIADLEWYIAKHPDDPIGHYELGLAQSTRDPTKGLASLDKALKLQPDFVAARSARGALNYIQGNAEAAVPDLEAAAASDPSNGMILDRLGQAYRALDRLADSVRVLQKAVDLAPSEPTILLHLANALAEAGKTNESDVLMDRYRQMRPTQAPRDLMRYLSLTPEQQRADYRARVEKAVHDNPGDANAQLHYLKLSLEDGQPAQAAAAAHAISGLKCGAALLADAGRALLEAQQYGPAKDLLERAAAADSTAGLELDLAVAAFHTAGANEGLRLIERVADARRDDGYYLARAQMLDAAGKFDEALSALDQAARVSPKRADLYWQEAVILDKAKRASELKRLLDRADEKLPHNPQIQLLRATLLDSRSLLDELQRQWPENAAVWVARGIMANRRGQFEEARRALQSAVTLGARSPEAFYYLADSTLRCASGNPAEADAALAEARRRAPDDPRLKATPGKDAPGPDLFRTRPPQDW